MRIVEVGRRRRPIECRQPQLGGLLQLGSQEGDVVPVHMAEEESGAQVRDQSAHQRHNGDRHHADEEVRERQSPSDSPQRTTQAPQEQPQGHQHGQRQ
jgi:hypothetical protein